MSMKGSRYMVSVAGRLGDDPKEFGANTGVSVSVAVDLPTRRDGKTVFEAEWHQVTAFGHAGKKLLEGRKGNYVIVDGQKSFEEYTSKQTGEIVKKPNILASAVQWEYEEDRGSGGGQSRQSQPDPAEEATGLY
jgi:single-stranded DNA-binding protein